MRRDGGGGLPNDGALKGGADAGGGVSRALAEGGAAPAKDPLSADEASRAAAMGAATIDPMSETRTSAL